MRVLLGMPCMRSIPFKTVVSLLRTAKKGAVEPLLIEGSLVYDSRDAIAKFAVENDFDYVLYVDSDMVFDSEDLNRLLAHNADICTGLYVTRNGENNNVLYSKVIKQCRFPHRDSKLITDMATSGYGSVVACGFGFCLIKTEVMKTLFKHYKSLFEPKWGVGEDVAFCIRAQKHGFKIFADRDVKLGHIGDMVYGGE